jgi:hypothetical protein
MTTRGLKAMSKETASIPRGVLGESVDQLLLEREDLEQRAQELYADWTQADAAIGPARRADTDAYAAALRKPDGRDPGKLVSAVAEQVLADARRACDAADAALAANEKDLRFVLEDRQAELRRLLDDELETVRSEALDHLERASQRLMRFGELSDLQVWCEKPTNASSDKLRPFVTQPLRVGLRGKNGELATAQSVFLLLGRRLEDGSTDAKAERAAREAGCSATRIERIEGKALSTGGRIKVTDIGRLGLCRYRVSRGTVAVDLVVRIDTADNTPLVELFKSASTQIDDAFDSKTPHVWADAEVERLITSVADEKSESPTSKQLRVREIAEVRAERENPAEVNQLRERAEQAAAV